MTAYLSAAAGFVNDTLIDLAFEAAAIGSAREYPPLAGIHIEPSWSSDCFLDAQGGRASPILKISHGWFIRSVYQAEAFSVAWLSARTQQSHYLTATQDWELELVPGQRRDLRKLTFELAPQLKPLFLDLGLSREDFCAALGEIEAGFLTHLDKLDHPIWPAQPSHWTQKLASMGLQFVVYHEAAHAVHRHHYLAANADAPFKRAIELDADIQALGWLLQSVVRANADADASGIEAELCFAFFAIASTLVGFDVGHRSISEYGTLTHPLPDFRYLLAADYWQHHLPVLGLAGQDRLYRRCWQTALCMARIALQQMWITGAGFSQIGSQAIRINWEPDLIVGVVDLDEIPWSWGDQSFVMSNWANAELQALAMGLAEIHALKTGA